MPDPTELKLRAQAYNEAKLLVDRRHRFFGESTAEEIAREAAIIYRALTGEEMPAGR